MRQPDDTTPLEKSPVLKPLNGEPGQQWIALNRAVCLIGDRSAVNLPLHSSKVSRSHAFIVVDDDGVFIHDLASLNHTFVNDAPIHEARLHRGDLLRIGPFAFSCDAGFPTQASTEAEKFEPAAMAQLLNTSSGSRVTLNRRRISSIGKRAECDIVLNSVGVAPSHAVVFRMGTAYFVRDLNSPGGTYVNGHVVRQRELRPGDEIRVGVATLQFIAEETVSPEPEAPARHAETAADESKLPIAFADFEPVRVPTAAVSDERLDDDPQPLRVTDGDALVEDDREQQPIEFAEAVEQLPTPKVAAARTVAAFDPVDDLAFPSEPDEPWPAAAPERAGSYVLSDITAPSEADELLDLEIFDESYEEGAISNEPPQPVGAAHAGALRSLDEASLAVTPEPSAGEDKENVTLVPLADDRQVIQAPGASLCKFCGEPVSWGVRSPAREDTTGQPHLSCIRCRDDASNGAHRHAKEVIAADRHLAEPPHSAHRGMLVAAVPSGKGMPDITHSAPEVTPEIWTAPDGAAQLGGMVERPAAATSRVKYVRVEEVPLKQTWQYAWGHPKNRVDNSDGGSAVQTGRPAAD